MTSEVKIQRYENGFLRKVNEAVATERRVKIKVNGRLYAELLASPTDLEGLAAGFLFSEGMIKNAADIISLNTGHLEVDVIVRMKEFIRPGKDSCLKPFHGPGQAGNRPPVVAVERSRSSGFGLGTVARDSFDRDLPSAPLVHPSMIKASDVTALMAEFNELSLMFKRTGAAHSAWLIFSENRFFAEDVGRHNALDKVVGRCLLSGGLTESSPGGFSWAPGRRLTLSPVWLFTSGRVTSEMVLKAAGPGADVLISRGAASAKALLLARAFGLTLICFARNDSFNILNGADLVC